MPAQAPPGPCSCRGARRPASRRGRPGSLDARIHQPCSLPSETESWMGFALRYTREDGQSSTFLDLQVKAELSLCQKLLDGGIQPLPPLLALLGVHLRPGDGDVAVYLPGVQEQLLV